MRSARTRTVAAAHASNRDWRLDHSGSACCGRFGGIDAVLNGMRAHAHVPAVQEYGCVALDVLALNSANQERVAAAGGIEVFVYSFRITTSLSANRLAAALA